MCCHLPRAVGKAKEGNKNLPILVATSGTLVPRQALPRGTASVGSLCGSGGLAGARAPRCGRDTGVRHRQGPCSPPRQGLLGKLGSTCPDGTAVSARALPWGQPVAEEADLPGWPWTETSTAPLAPALCDGLPKTLLGGEIQRGK